MLELSTINYKNNTLVQIATLFRDIKLGKISWLSMLFIVATKENISDGKTITFLEVSSKMI